MRSGLCCPIFVYGGAIFALPGNALLWLQRCDFWTVESLFSLTTAAQNIHVFLRKSPLCRNHFFGWSKTANSSTACGTVTLKSPPPRAFSAPRVHPRPRKRLARCTLDCGFKTSESPALRGFVGERCPIRGTSLYLVIFSNGPHRSKNPPVKFGFLPKTVPANIAKKLPLQLRPKPLLIAIFNFPRKRPTFAFTGESGYASPLLKGSHTRAYTAKQGAFQMGCYYYPRTVSHVSETLRGQGVERQTLPLLGLGWGHSRRTQRAFGTAMRMMRVAVPRRRGPAGLRDPVSALWIMW